MTPSVAAASPTVAPAAPFAVVSTAVHDREWWAEEAVRAGTDWSGLVAAALEMMVAAPQPETITPWDAPSWREAAIAYHKDRPASPAPSPAPSAGKPNPPEREIWRAAGQCIRRLGGRDALDTFRAWCRRHVSPSAYKRADAIFEMIVQKELSK
jgi:hypothetical protein